MHFRTPKQVITTKQQVYIVKANHRDNSQSVDADNILLIIPYTDLIRVSVVAEEEQREVAAGGRRNEIYYVEFHFVVCCFFIGLNVKKF